jgi:hypothetical protein
MGWGFCWCCCCASRMMMWYVRVVWYTTPRVCSRSSQ